MRKKEKCALMKSDKGRIRGLIEETAKKERQRLWGGGGGQRWKRETVYLYTLSSVLVRMTFGFRTSTDGIKIFF